MVRALPHGRPHGRGTRRRLRRQGQGGQDRRGQRAGPGPELLGELDPDPAGDQRRQGRGQPRRRRQQGRPGQDAGRGLALNQRSFLATGATSVLGRALLRRLWADPAWAGVVFYLAGRDLRVLEDLCAQARAAGSVAHPWVLDLAGDPKEGEAGLRKLPPLKGFVFAAGATHDQTLALMDQAAYDQIMRVNFGGHARLIKALHEPGRLADGARGLLIGSNSGLRGQKGQTAYAAAKGGLVDLLPLAPSGLRLNVLLPPLMLSPMLDALKPQARADLFQNRHMDD